MLNFCTPQKPWNFPPSTLLEAAYQSDLDTGADLILFWEALIVVAARHKSAAARDLCFLIPLIVDREQRFGAWENDPLRTDRAASIINFNNHVTMSSPPHQEVCARPRLVALSFDVVASRARR